ncbi:peptidase family C78-domain-containing protein [Chytridium lagenaria]|nr:peptidase family C78-domain-containing protein [Chytridium lagenaria]
MRWGCGYRNIQMLMSSLSRLPSFAEGMQENLKKSGLRLEPSISAPSIPTIQETIENAWAEGFDKAGAAQLKNCLVGTKKWIGATEAMVRLKDFPSPSGAGNAHPALLDFVEAYFDDSLIPFDEERKRSHQYPLIFPRKSTGSIVMTTLPPLYLQFSGHSVTIIGIEIMGGTRNLLVFDPAVRIPMPLAAGGRGKKSLREFLAKARTLDSEKVLHSIRVPMEELVQNSQYQIVQRRFAYKLTSERID